jgi:hypothetical protein
MEVRLFSQRIGHSNPGHNASVKAPSSESLWIPSFLVAHRSSAGPDPGLLMHLESSYETHTHLFVCPYDLQIFFSFRKQVMIA